MGQAFALDIDQVLGACAELKYYEVWAKLVWIVFPTQSNNVSPVAWYIQDSGEFTHELPNIESVSVARIQSPQSW